jgi:hypothetical protein
MHQEIQPCGLNQDTKGTLPANRHGSRKRLWPKKNAMLWQKKNALVAATHDLRGPVGNLANKVSGGTTNGRARARLKRNEATR